jgi:hypothetical protein
MADEKRDRQEQEDVIDGEVVAEFEDHTLMNLPSVDGDEEDSTGEAAGGEVDLGRRQFFTRLAVGGVAALALGGSAALLLYRQRGEPTVVILPNGAAVGSGGEPADVAALYERVAELEYQLASVTAERDQLLSDLTSGDTEYQRLHAQLEETQAELEELRNINGLWQTMDQIGLDGLLRAAITLVGNSLTAFLAVLGLMQSGVAKGQSVIAKFINSLPGPQAGIRWLQERASRLADDLEWLGEQVENVVEATGPLTQKITEFILWILDRLPFGAGDKARAGMDAMETVINSLPNLIDGINTSVLEPLAVWFDADDDGNLAGILLDPIAENLVEPARETLSEFTTFQKAYEDELASPALAALDERDAIRSQIQEAQARLGMHV